MFRGKLPFKSRTTLYAASLLTETSHEISQADFAVISKLSEIAWTPVKALGNDLEASVAQITQLVRQGLLISDSPDPELKALRDRCNKLVKVRWNRYSQLMHFMTKWSDGFLDASQAEWRDNKMPSSFLEFEQRFGPAPPPLIDMHDESTSIPLPLTTKRGTLYRLLAQRHTTRAFDRRRKISLRDLSVVLYYCFGCHGYRKLSETLTVLKKTSPSGGALHPIEIFPLIIGAKGLAPGVYHYDVTRHSLDLLTKLSAEKARSAALRTVADQEGLADAHVIFILVARYGRYFWKYQNHPKAYKVIAMEAAHLSQTNYLVCTELGLGAYVTAAINDSYIESLIGLDGTNDGVIAVCGCGIPKAQDPQQFGHRPFKPRYSNLPD